jgi:hypothetical protein
MSPLAWILLTSSRLMSQGPCRAKSTSISMAMTYSQKRYACALRNGLSERVAKRLMGALGHTLFGMRGVQVRPYAGRNDANSHADSAGSIPVTRSNVNAQLGHPSLSLAGAAFR